MHTTTKTNEHHSNPPTTKNQETENRTRAGILMPRPFAGRSAMVVSGVPNGA